MTVAFESFELYKEMSVFGRICPRHWFRDFKFMLVAPTVIADSGDALK